MTFLFASNPYCFLINQALIYSDGSMQTQVYKSNVMSISIYNS